MDKAIDIRRTIDDAERAEVFFRKAHKAIRDCSEESASLDFMRLMCQGEEILEKYGGDVEDHFSKHDQRAAEALINAEDAKIMALRALIDCRNLRK